MKVISSAAAMRRLAEELRRQGRVGFVPTMGALHEGHLSLVRLCRRHSDSVVVSVFVNPTQFGPGEDLARYPRPFARDRRLLRKEGVDAVFHPDARTMYPPGAATWVTVEGLTEGLCGRFRPGHFRGVTTIVAKLFNVVRPDVAVFGQKDIQQALVIQRMTRDLAFGTKIVLAPTVREPDGLAMSSRNAYLSPVDREQAPVLYQALRHARKMVRSGERSTAKVRREMLAMIRARSSGRVQYAEIVDAEDLKPTKRIEDRVVIALAAYFGRTRLIDNIVLSV